MTSLQKVQQLAQMLPQYPCDAVEDLRLTQQLLKSCWEVLSAESEDLAERLLNTIEGWIGHEIFYSID